MASRDSNLQKLISVLLNKFYESPFDSPFFEPVIEGMYVPTTCQEWVVLGEDSANFLWKVFNTLSRGERSRPSEISPSMQSLWEGRERLKDYRYIPDLNLAIVNRLQECLRSQAFAEALSWNSWLLLLRSYERQFMQIQKDSPQAGQHEENARKMMDLFAEGFLDLIAATANSARQAKDWGTLLLVASYCRMAGLDYKADSLYPVRDVFGEQGVIRHLFVLETSAKMFVQCIMLGRLRRQLVAVWPGVQADLPDYYAILQVSPNAQQEVIEAAYRRLARISHPDVNPSPAANQKMLVLNQAYAVLADPAARAHYDLDRLSLFLQDDFRLKGRAEGTGTTNE